MKFLQIVALQRLAAFLSGKPVGGGDYRLEARIECYSCKSRFFSCGFLRVCVFQGPCLPPATGVCARRRRCHTGCRTETHVVAGAARRDPVRTATHRPAACLQRDFETRAGCCSGQGQGHAPAVPVCGPCCFPVLRGAAHTGSRGEGAAGAADIPSAPRTCPWRAGCRV